MVATGRGRSSALRALAFALVAGLAGIAHAQSGAGDAAEIAFWNSIKDSRNAAEYQAYLQAFPNGVFAPLARLRVQQLGGAAQTPPPAGGQPPRQATQQPQTPATGGVDTRNPQIVAEIQDKLYNLNYDITRFDGTLDEATQQAIREWQERIEAPVTGVLTQELFQRLRSARPPKVWGTIAYTANGTIGRAWNRPSRKDSEETALAECRRRAGRNADCSVQSAGDSACVALATYRSTIGDTVYYGARPSLKPQLQQAVQAAMESCQRAERSNGTCANRISLCADGSHEKD